MLTPGWKEDSVARVWSRGPRWMWSYIANTSDHSCCAFTKYSHANIAASAIDRNTMTFGIMATTSSNTSRIVHANDGRIVSLLKIGIFIRESDSYRGKRSDEEYRETHSFERSFHNMRWD
jgi:hypothetical protein